MTKIHVNGRIIRWLLLLQQFDLTIIEKLGKGNVVAYILSIPTLLVENEVMIDDQLLDEHLFSISVISSWFADIANYSVARRFPPNLSSKEKTNIVRETATFTWIGGNNFRLGPNNILRTCVREEEVFEILSSWHNGPYGAHFAAKRTTSKFLQLGYYCPTLHQDARRYTSRCDQCQRMGKPTPKDEIPLQPQVTLEPFEKWGMHFIGSIDPPSGHKRYNILCIDYLTKWAETKVLKVTTE